MKRFHSIKFGDKIVSVPNNSVDESFSKSDDCVIGIGLYEDKDSVFRSILSFLDVQKEFYPIAEKSFTSKDKDFDNLIMKNIVFSESADGKVEGTITLGALRKVKNDLGL